MAKTPKKDASVSQEGHLSDNEGSLLGLVLRNQPVTAYQLYKMYELSPVSSFNTSKGSLYPLISRLKTRGLIASEAKPGDKRNTEFLACTKAGQKALTSWAGDLSTAHIVLDDPLRTKLQSLDLLTPEQQLEWVVEAKELVAQRMTSVDAFHADGEGAFDELLHRGATLALKAKMEWLDLVLYQLVKKKGAPAGVA